jgi:glycine/D-amino acid oxidase-like deaminating enzyme
VDWWSPDRIKKEFPLVEVNDFVGGTFGPRDGYLDPYALLMAYRSKAVSLGVRFIADFDTRWPIPGRRQGGI